MTAVLTAERLGVTFGGLEAVVDFNLKIEPGTLTGLIGPNGAGKTTVFNLLTGVYKPTQGCVLIGEKDMCGKRPDQFVHDGLARTFQNIRLFKNMTVLDNVKLAFNINMKYGMLDTLLRSSNYRKEEKLAEDKAMELLRVFEMEDLADQLACNLPYGKQRKLEIARALATNPKVLLLDEPAAGMNPTETGELMTTIALLREKYQLAILLIEHDMSLVMGICERVIVLDYGRVIADGTPNEITHNKRVIEAYLGEDDEEEEQNDAER